MKENLMDGLVSVIIPFYNVVAWLEEAIISVKQQTVQPLEIIVVNDGSKEDISSLIKKYTDVIFFVKENGGAATARNKGIELARGKYCAFLDSDDIWVPTKLEEQISLLEKSEKKWSATAYKSFGNGIESIVIPYAKKEKCYDIISNSCKIQTSTVVILTEVLKNDTSAIFAEDMKNGQDVYLWLYLADKYELAVLEKPLTLFRLRGTNAHLNICTHIRVRALLWEKMNRNDLPIPKLGITRLGYKICSRLFYKNDCYKEATKLMKVQFCIAWILFRMGKFIASH